LYTETKEKYQEGNQTKIIPAKGRHKC
jgi:hypothetical protein